MQTLRENKFIVELCYGRRRYALFSWLLLDFLQVSQTSYKQVSKQLAESTLNGKNMDNFTALFTSSLGFTFGTNSMHASVRGYEICVFLMAFFYKLMLFESLVKDAVGTVDHTQIPLASPGPVEAYTCRSNSTSSVWVC